MALKKSFTFDPAALGFLDPQFVTDHVVDGVTPEMYIKVLHVSGNQTQITADAGVFLNPDDAEPTWSKRFIFPARMDNTNFIQQAYDNMKTTVAMAGAVDC